MIRAGSPIHRSGVDLQAFVPANRFRRLQAFACLEIFALSPFLVWRRIRGHRSDHFFPTRWPKTGQFTKFRAVEAPVENKLSSGRSRSARRILIHQRYSRIYRSARWKREKTTKFRVPKSKFAIISANTLLKAAENGFYIALTRLLRLLKNTQEAVGGFELASDDDVLIVRQPQPLLHPGSAYSVKITASGGSDSL